MFLIVFLVVKEIVVILYTVIAWDHGITALGLLPGRGTSTTCAWKMVLSRIPKWYYVSQLLLIICFRTAHKMCINIQIHEQKIDAKYIHQQ